jgi:hypothetical protein
VFEKVLLGALGLESPHGGAIWNAKQKSKGIELMISGAYVAEAQHLRQKTGVEHHPSHVFASLLPKNV